MLELIFQGFIEWIYSLVLECWNWFSTSLLDIMSLDLAYIRSHVPIITDIMQVLLAVGWALLLGNLVFQALKGMAAGLGFEAEDPKMLFGRSAVFSFLLLASPQICEIALDMTSRIITLLQLPNAINVHLVDASILGNLLAGWLVVIICNIIIMWNVLKLLLKIAEQYVVLSTLTITAPLAFSMGGSKSTAPIFTGWCRMYGSMCLLMVTNVMFFKMLLSVMSAIPSGLDVFPWMVLIFSIVKVAKRMDDTITRIGLNPAQTGGGGGRSLPGMVAATVVRGAVSQVGKTIGGAVSTAGKGAVSAGTAVAGAAGGAAGAASAGLGSIFRPGRGQNTSQQSNSQQVHNQQSGPQQSSTQQSQQNMANAPQPAPSQTVSPAGGMAYTGGPSSTTSTSSTTGGNTSQNHRSSTTRHSRNSSVPSGTRRAPSYVRSTVSSQPGTAGTGTDSRSTETTVRGGSFGGGSRGGFGDGSRVGGFGGSSRGGSFGNGRRTTTTTTEKDHSTSRGGRFGGGSGSGSGGTTGSSPQSPAASSIERNRSSITRTGATVEKTSTNIGGSQTGAGSAGTAVPRPGMAGTAPGSTTTPRPGMAGTTIGSTTTPRSGAAGTSRGSTSNAPRPGAAGTAPGGTAAPRPGTAGTGTNSQTTHLTGGSKAGPETPVTPRPGIAGTGINGQAVRRSGSAGPASGPSSAPRPGTAGTSTGSSTLPNPGAAGTGASTVPAKGQTVQPGAATPHGVSTRSTRVTGKERASRAPISSGGAATPPATTTVQHTQSTESRSTRRSVTESKQTVTRNSAERAARPSGTAGTAAPGTVRQPTAIPQAGRVVPPVTGPQPPKQARSSPVQQETRQTSVSAKAPVGGTSPVVRPGTAGTASETHCGQIERTTARKTSEDKKSGAKQPQAPGIKRQSTPPAATGKKPGPKTPDRSRGSGHG